MKISWIVNFFVIAAHAAILVAPLGSNKNSSLIGFESSPDSLTVRVVAGKKPVTTSSKIKKPKTFSKKIVSKKAPENKDVSKVGKAGVSSGAKLMGTLAPKYPPRARRLNQQGHVRLRFIVNADGSAQSVSIFQSSGHKLLDNEAINSIKRASFTPALKNGVPVASEKDLSIKFELK